MPHNPGMDLPIACTLTEAQRRHRRQTIMDIFRTMEDRITEWPDGDGYSFAATSDVLTQIAQLVEMERQCCSFLAFKIVVEPAGGQTRLEVTGPEGASAIKADYFNG